jgi:hypothetical protein
VGFWHTENWIDVVAVDDNGSYRFSLDFGYWFRTMPLVIVISYDPHDARLEATALSCHKGLVSGGVAWEHSEWPVELRFSNPAQTEVYNLLVAGAAYKNEYMTQAEREASLSNLDFLIPPSP